MKYLKKFEALVEAEETETIYLRVASRVKMKKIR